MATEPNGAEVPTTAGQACSAKLAEANEELAGVVTRLEQIEREQQDLLRKQERLEIVIETLEPLCRQMDDEEKEQRVAIWSEVENLGIQECCYRVLLEAEDPLSAQDIRFELKELGIDMDRYANPSAVIHTSLKRIPERVRSFKRYCMDPVTEKRATSRFYEAIREKKKTAGKAKPAEQ